MCIAILNTPNITFSKSIIKTCWENNSDGAGLIWTDTKRKRLHTFKELDSVEAYYAKYIEVRRKHPKSKVVLHFRISTSGGVNLNNTHPFEVNAGLAFVHNGVISELNGIDKQRSDTNLFNLRVLQNLPAGFERNQAIADLIAKYIGHSKLIFLNANNEHTIINPSLGKSDPTYSGCWFSNSTYKPSAYYDYGGKQIAKAGYKSAALPVQTSKVYRSGDEWNANAQAWQAYQAPAPSPAVKHWDTKAQDWKQASPAPITTETAKPVDNPLDYTFDPDKLSDEDWIEWQILTATERAELQELRNKPTNSMTAQEWQTLNAYETILDQALYGDY
jgi:predicted glutamine amidotransferase